MLFFDSETFSETCKNFFHSHLGVEIDGSELMNLSRDRKLNVRFLYVSLFYL